MKKIIFAFLVSVAGAYGMTGNPITTQNPTTGSIRVPLWPIEKLQKFKKYIDKIFDRSISIYLNDISKEAFSILSQSEREQAENSDEVWRLISEGHTNYQARLQKGLERIHCALFCLEEAFKHRKQDLLVSEKNVAGLQADMIYIYEYVKENQKNLKSMNFKQKLKEWERLTTMPRQQSFWIVEYNAVDQKGQKVIKKFAKTIENRCLVIMHDFSLGTSAESSAKTVSGSAMEKKV